ncbi:MULTISPECIES: hypothetical protein [Acidobacterium]|uniref:Uncharacterized protein n=1 Tax=Acidobacterium capsulatum (strain ATCC 51196 / DSM 11244 / BCRC 80197 / JCM 7670 / NBRC 15755 / NCIMB 13165 / 161) TaxID=240015 RepID=C1F3C2_ACIC5|nr:MULTISPECIES: hypothetical protein [Acidobacterium]ACO33819.1 hypothetical protein ACP_2816 [Acidobacterium capsulatum ATCC 51196]HCT60594.1 hypothetical protein [Acidobacterium sp.]
MPVPLLLVLVLATMLVYYTYWKRKQDRVRSSSWDWIASQLRSNNEFNFDRVSHRYLYEDGITATPSNVWEKINGVAGLWAMFRNAGLFLRLADYATDHGAEAPEELLESLRADAIQIRVAVLLATAKYLSTYSQVAASVNAHRAATAYSSMLAHMTRLFQDHSTLLFPRFLECM